MFCTSPSYQETPLIEAADSTDFVQLLDAAGRRVEHPSFTYVGSDADIAGRLRDMMLARRIDSEATALQRKGELGLWPPMLLTRWSTQRQNCQPADLQPQKTWGLRPF